MNDTQKNYLRGVIATLKGYMDEQAEMVSDPVGLSDTDRNAAHAIYGRLAVMVEQAEALVG